MSIALIALASFFTWFCSRRRDILLSVIAGLLWFSLAMWLFFSTAPPFDLTETHSQVLAWVFVILTFVPFILYMNVRISVTDSKGRTWEEYGDVPENKVSSYEQYVKDLRSRTRRQYKRRRLL